MQKIYRLWIIVLVVKLIIAAILPLFHDETYYLFWSNNLQLSYYDHPPFVALIFWLGHFLEPFGHAVRWPAVVVAHFTSLVWIFILKPYVDEKKLYTFALLLFSIPLLGPGSIIVTPDLPLMLFWALSVLWLKKYIAKPSLQSASILGALVGLGLLAKYHMVLFVPSAILYLYLSKQLIIVKFSHYATAIFFAFIFCSPVIIWNIQNDFISFRFQLDHGLGKDQWNPLWTVAYLFSQFMLLSPNFFVSSLRFTNISRERLLFVVFGWLPIVFFLMSSFRGKVESNWPITGHAALIALVVIGSSRIKNLQRTAYTWAFVFLLLLSEIFLGWWPFNWKPSKLHEASEFDAIVPVVKPLNSVYARTFQMASQLSYKLNRPIYKLRGMNRKDFFDFHPRSLPDTKKYYFIAQKGDGIPLELRKKGHRLLSKKNIDQRFDLYEIQQQ